MPLSVTNRIGKLMVTVSLLFFAIGCTNEPGALKLTLKADKPAYRTDEPIGIVAILKTTDKLVALTKEYTFQAEMTKVGDPVVHIQNQERGFCGMGGLFLLMCPWVIPFAWLDVADLQEHFDVMKTDGYRSKHLSFQVREIQGKALIAQWGSSESLALIPGEYSLTVKLDNRCDPGIVPPLFWKPYDRPVSATTPILIVDVPTSASSDEKSRPGNSP